MSDIVERLQDTVGSVKWPVSSEMLKEAATEILRLRAENEKLRAKLQAATGELCDRAAAAALKETGDE